MRDTQAKNVAQHANMLSLIAFLFLSEVFIYKIPANQEKNLTQHYILKKNKNKKK